MAGQKKQNVRAVFKIAAWLGFIMLGYLGIRGYKNSVEKLKINQCTDELGELVENIINVYNGQRGYEGLEYNTAVRLGIFPKKMFREGFKEATNSYLGGVDLFYSAASPSTPYAAFEISFQGVSKMGCEELLRIPLDNLIAVGGYATPTPSGVLDEIYESTKQDDIRSYNIFKGTDVRYIGSDKVDRACGCSDDTCSVVWKFR